VSVEAISWALNLAPVPRDRSGKRNPACKAVLVGLANHAAPDGREAFPSVRTLVRYTDLSERTVRTALDRLEADSIIQPCDPAVVAAKIKRADQRPQGWDLAMHLVRDDLDDEDLAALERQFPGLTARVAAMRAAAGSLRRDDPGGGVQRLHPAAGTPVDNVADGVQPLHPALATGCNHRWNGVQPPRERGAVVAPEPSFEPSREPSAARARDPAPVAVDDRPGTGGAGEFFAQLGPDWPLTDLQRRRLEPMAAAALAAGWAPAALAAFVGANTAGIRSPAAVLAARLSPAELPAPSNRVRARAPWCGECDERTRRLQRAADGADTGRCPRCHPLAAGGTGKTGQTPEACSPQTAVLGTLASMRVAPSMRVARGSRAPSAQLPPPRDVASLPPAGSCLCAAGSACGGRCGRGGRPRGRGPGQAGVSVARNRSGSRCSQRRQARRKASISLPWAARSAWAPAYSPGSGRKVRAGNLCWLDMIKIVP